MRCTGLSLLLYPYQLEDNESVREGLHPALDVARTTRIGQPGGYANSVLTALRQTLRLSPPGSRSLRLFS